jgi:porin
MPTTTLPPNARSPWRAALLAGTLIAAPLFAGAQQTNSGAGLGPSQGVSQPAPVVTPPTENLFGDWGGVRTSLGNLGISFTLDLMSEAAGNVSGGTRQGFTFANQVGFETDIDWGKLAGLDGFSTHVVIVNRSGSSDSVLFGDHVNAVQEIYGGGGDVIAHLVYAYGEQSLLGGRVDIAAGRMPVLNDFAASPLYCNFMNVSICGNPGALAAGDIGLSTWPASTWGGRVRVRPTDSIYVQAGVYEVSQGIFSASTARSGFDFTTARDTGAEFPLELGYEPTIGPAKLPGHYKLGVAYDTSNYPDFFSDSAGAPASLSGAAFRNHHGRVIFWALADQMLLRQGPGADDGLILLGAYVHGDPATTAYESQYTAGLIDKGFWRARPGDTAGLLFTYQKISGTLGREQALQQEFGLPLSHSATGAQTSEMIFEANYDIHVYRGVNLQPEFEYVVRPNAQSGIKNAEVFGVKTHVNF